MNAFALARRGGLIASALVVTLGFGLYGCTAMGAAPAGAQQRADGSAAARAPAAPAAGQDQGGDSLPPGWPWRGVNMSAQINQGATPQTIDRFVNEFGINSVRLFIPARYYARIYHLDPREAMQRALKWLDSMLMECKKDHIVAVVYFADFPKPSGGYYRVTSPDFWNDKAAVQEIYTEVGLLAQHMHKYGSEFAAYDIISEPVLKSGHGPQQPPDWPQIETGIVKSIRKYDPGRWVLAEPGPWGGAPGYATFSPLPVSKIVYSVHVYVPLPYTHQGIRNYLYGVRYPGKIGHVYWDKQALEHALAPVIGFQRRYGVPVYVGEFSAMRWAPGSRQYLEDLVSIFDAHDWGWAYFDVGGWNGWNPTFDSSFTPGAKPGQAHQVGDKSERWKTLSIIFGNEHGGSGGTQ